MAEHWANPETRPSACTYFAGGVGVQNYSFDNLWEALDRAACSVSDFPDGAEISYRVFRVTAGNKGCGGGTDKRMSRELGERVTECPPGWW